MTDQDAQPAQRRPSGDRLADELRKGHRVRFQVTAMFVAVVVGSTAGLAYYRYERTHDCQVARQVRGHSEQLDRDVFSRLGQRFHLPAAEMQAVLQDISDSYDAMPEPAAC